MMSWIIYIHGISCLLQTIGVHLKSLAFDGGLKDIIKKLETETDEKWKGNLERNKK